MLNLLRDFGTQLVKKTFFQLSSDYGTSRNLGGEESWVEKKAANVLQSPALEELVHDSRK